MNKPPPPDRAARILRRSTALRPTLGIILGSGFGAVRNEIGEAREIAFKRLPGFPPVRVAGHSPTVVAGRLEGVPVLLLSGRAHYYEGHPMSAVTFPVRVLAEFGIRDLLLTNAAGGIRRRFRPGDFMCATDHINWMGANPLRGEMNTGSDCFVDLSQVYAPHLLKWMLRAARETRVRVHRGVYLAVSGPSYETPAEIRAFARLGADAVGMSTVPEAIVARQCGMSVAALSCITNLAAGRNPRPLSHREVLETGKRAQGDAIRLLKRFVKLYFADSSTSR
jgi:purine-nucleoside phosphorylase